MMVLLLMLCFTSCLKTEVIGMPEEEEAVEAEKRKKPFPEQPIDSTQTDTARVAIGWNPSVEDWTNQDVTMQN
jgi:hypothetical protein